MPYRLSSASKQPSSARKNVGDEGIAIFLIVAPVALSRIHSALTSPTYRFDPTTSRPSGPDMSLLAPAQVGRGVGAVGFPLLHPANAFLNCPTTCRLWVSMMSIDLLVRSVT